MGKRGEGALEGGEAEEERMRRKGKMMVKIARLRRRSWCQKETMVMMKPKPAW